MHISHLFFHFYLVFLLAFTVNAANTNNWAVIVSASRYWFNYRVSGL